MSNQLHITSLPVVADDSGALLYPVLLQRPVPPHGPDRYVDPDRSRTTPEPHLAARSGRSSIVLFETAPSPVTLPLDPEVVVGRFEWQHRAEQGSVVDNVHVRESWRRRGLGTRMLQMALQIEPGLVEDTDLSADARAWMASDAYAAATGTFTQRQGDAKPVGTNTAAVALTWLRELVADSDGSGNPDRVCRLGVRDAQALLDLVDRLSHSPDSPYPPVRRLHAVPTPAPGGNR